MAVTASDHWITTEPGRLFARVWTPWDLRRESDATILVFHDSLGCVELWRDFPEQVALATGRRVVAYDRLGFGRSDAYPGALPLTFIDDEAVAAVPRLCDALELERIIPLGHSTGGSMAIATAARLSERCAAVLTESAMSFVEDRTHTGVRAAKAYFQQPEQLARLARYHGEKARWVLDAWIETWLSPAFVDWCLDDDLRRVHCPTLVLHGDRDEYASVQQPQRITRLTQGLSRAVILGHCGHVPHREQPTRVLSEITRFLAPPGEISSKPRLGR